MLDALSGDRVERTKARARHVIEFRVNVDDSTMTALTFGTAVELSPRTPWGDPDSRGCREGDTLVIETTNFNGKVGLTRNGNTLLTSADPATWTRPWKVALPLTVHPGYQFFEYACHEGYYAMRNILSAERPAEREKADKAASPASGAPSQP